MNTIEDLLSKVTFTETELQEITCRLSHTEILKGQEFLKLGEVCNKLGVLIKGLLVAGYYNSDKESITSRFYYSPYNIIVLDSKSFIQRSPSTEFIKAAEDSYLSVISHKDLQYLFDTIPTMNILGRQLAEASYLQALDYIKILQSEKTDDKLDIFFDVHQSILNRVTNVNIASYLGVHRNTLNGYIKKNR